MRYIVRKVVIALKTEYPCNDVAMAVKTYGHSVQSLAFVFLKNKYDAEDIAQEVFIAYIKKAPHFPSAQAERSWLMTVTANKSKSLLRSAYRQDTELRDDLAELQEEESNILEAVLELEEKYRVAIHLHYYEGYTIEDIAKMMHVRYGTVGSWLSRGRELLRMKLKEDYLDD